MPQLCTWPTISSKACDFLGWASCLNEGSVGTILMLLQKERAADDSTITVALRSVSSSRNLTSTPESWTLLLQSNLLPLGFKSLAS